MILIHAFDLGSCTKASVARLLGYEPASTPELLTTAFARGHEIEGEIVRWLEQEHRFVFTTHQSEHLIACGEVEDEAVAVECHTDGEGGNVKWPDVVVEAKSASADSYGKWVSKGWGRADGLWEKYKWQVSCYMHATGKNVLFVVQSKEGERCELCKGTGWRDVSLVFDATGHEVTKCTPCDGTGSIPLGPPPRHYSLVTTPFHTLRQITTRARKIAALAQTLTLPESCDRDDYFCPFAYLHEAKFDSGGEWEEIAREYDRESATFSAAKNHWDRRRDYLKNRLMHAALNLRESDQEGLPWHNDGSRVVDTGQVRVNASWGPVGMPRIDQKKMVTDGVDPRKYLEQKYGYRLRVTVRDEEESLGS